MRRRGQGEVEISNSQDIIDSREVIARIEYLEELEQAAVDAKEEVLTDLGVREEDLDPSDLPDDLPDGLVSIRGTIYGDTVDFGEDEYSELQALKSLRDDAEGCGDWSYGATLISADYWEDYVRQYAEDIGAIDPNATWPLNHIDWAAAADELLTDYTTVDFDGRDYYVRS